MKGQGVAISREQMRLVRRREGLQVASRRKIGRLLGQTTQWVHRAGYPNYVWSYDFVFDQTDDRRRLKCLMVIDEFISQGLGFGWGSATSRDVIRTYSGRVVSDPRPPMCLRSDNDPELVSDAVQKWFKDEHVDTQYMDPGSRPQNA